MQNENNHLHEVSPVALSWTGDWSRQTESDLVNRCVSAAGTGRPAADRDEADIFRLVAQLLKTRYPIQACKLEDAASVYFGSSIQLPRSFPETVQDGLVRDVARLRHLLESACEGVRSW